MKADLQNSHPMKKKGNCIVMNVNQTYRGNHFAICKHTKSLCCTLKTNTMSYVNYTSIKRRKTISLTERQKQSNS